MALDDDSLELLERRMSERVEARVRSNVFKLYGTVGGGVIAALAYFGYDVISTVHNKADEIAKQAVSQAVGPAVTDADNAAKEAQIQASHAAATIEVLDGWMAGRTQKLSELEENVQKTLSGIDRLTRDQQARIDSVAGKLQTSEETLDDQRVRAADLYAGQGDLRKLADQLVSLSDQVKALDLKISQFPQSGNAVSTAAPARQSPAQTAIQEIISKSEAIIPATEGDHVATVYFQFAGVERSVAEAIRTALAGKNFNMPGEERTGIAAGLREVRYFFPEDKSAAEQLAVSVNKWLTTSGYEAAVSAKDYTKYSRAKPKPGVIELWLEPKPAKPKAG